MPMKMELNVFDLFSRNECDSVWKKKGSNVEGKSVRNTKAKYRQECINHVNAVIYIHI